MGVVDDIWRTNDADTDGWWVTDAISGCRLLRWRKSHRHIRQFKRPTSAGRRVVVAVSSEWRLRRSLMTGSREHRLFAAPVVDVQPWPRSERTWLRLIGSARGISREVSGVMLTYRKWTVIDDWVFAVVLLQHLQQPFHLQSQLPPRYIVIAVSRQLVPISSEGCDCNRLNLALQLQKQINHGRPFYPEQRGANKIVGGRPIPNEVCINKRWSPSTNCEIFRGQRPLAPEIWAEIWASEKVDSVGRNAGPIFRRLWTKVHQIW